MKRLTLATLALSACLFTAVQATTASPLTLEQQARKADVIVQATIGTPTTVTEGGQAYSVYPLKVSETLAGDAAQLPQLPGGQGGSGPALYVLSGMELAPVFQSGQEAVLLLYKGRLDSPLVGFNQGAFLISNGLVSVLPIQPVPGQGGAVPGASSTPPGIPLTPPVQNQPVLTPATQTPATQPPTVSTPVIPTPAAQPAPVATVLGSLRTSAELKAAIVAARAAK